MYIRRSVLSWVKVNNLALSLNFQCYSCNIEKLEKIGSGLGMRLIEYYFLLCNPITGTLYILGNMNYELFFFQNERTAPHYQSTLQSTQQNIGVELSLVRLRLQRESLTNLVAVAKSILTVLK